MSALAFPIVVGALALLAAWTTAALVLPAWTWLLRAWPPAARAAGLVATVPALAGGALVLAAVLPGDPHLDQPFGCHCAASMPAWSHLCPVHPGEALALVPLALAVLAALAPGRARAWWRLAREPAGLGHPEPTVLPLPAPTAVLVGWWRPSLVIDAGLWTAHSDPERAAVLAHERAHVARLDPTLLMALRALAALGPPRAAAAFARAWLDRAEERADALAARAVGDPIVVAEALVRCARLGAGSRELAPAWTGGRVERRVAALLAGATPASERPDASLVDLAVVVALASAALAATPWVHHQVEHLLNWSP